MSWLRDRGVVLACAGLTAFTVGRAGILAASVFTLSTGVMPDPWSLGNILLSLAYTGPVLGIIWAHEQGHRVAAHKAGLHTDGPYLIPFPLWLAGWIGYGVPAFGTLGAVLRVRGWWLVSPSDRWDIAVRGPLWGFVVAAVCVLVGAWLSVPSPRLGSRLYVPSIVEAIVGSGVAWHPLALAGWLGVLMTGVNLLPVPGLDGWTLLTTWGEVDHWRRAGTVAAGGLACACFL